MDFGEYEDDISNEEKDSYRSTCRYYNAVARELHKVENYRAWCAKREQASIALFSVLPETEENKEKKL